MSFKELKKNILYLGSQDNDKKLFDQLIPLPDGTSYNAYLIKGSEKTALVDTVYPSKAEELIFKLKQANAKIDYIISNHGEQDHSGSIPRILELYPDAKVVTNAKCKNLIMEMLLVKEDKFIEIKDGETLSLGDKTVQFIMAPWVHWPDTMFSYLIEDKILFTCDFLGSHVAGNDLFVVDEHKIYEGAKRYYAEIMMPFRTHINKYLQKINALDVDIIAPSHGPVYQNPEFILDAYQDWISDNVKNEVLIAYVSMYESTLKMVNYLKDALIKKGITVNTRDIIETELGELAIDLVDPATIILGSPMVLSGLHPNVAHIAYLVNALRPKFKFASIIGSFGWGGKMIEQCQSFLTSVKPEFIQPVLIKGCPKEEDYKLLDELAEAIYEKHKTLIILNT
jgi:flavorubredoxin